MANPNSPKLNSAPRPIVVLGPTAGGKSELAVQLSQWCATYCDQPAQIISADSMQIYCHMDAGTAKPSPDQQARAKHHLINCAQPTERFTVSHWLDRADQIIAELQADNVTPIIVGGTNLYIKAMLQGLFEGPAKDETLRAKLLEQTPQQLHVQLKQIDPAAATRIHPNDQKRLIRAIEVYELTGKPISDLQTQWTDDTVDTNADDLPTEECNGYRHNPILIGMAWLAEEINPRINLRVKAMFYPDKVDPALAREVTPSGESLIDETRRLEETGLLGEQAREALGYKQVLNYIHGRCSLDESYERTKILTRRFAKQQRTWLKRFRDVDWFDAANLNDEQRLGRATEAL
jgi:tRNA dimethylallyltransferase